MNNKNSIEDELARSMMANLDEVHGHEQINPDREASEALNMLHSAASIFEQAGYVQAAEYITLVISKFGSREE